MELVRKRGGQVLYGVTPPMAGSRQDTAGQGAGTMGVDGGVPQHRSRRSWSLSRGDSSGSGTPAQAHAPASIAARGAATVTAPSIPSPGPVVSLEEAAAAAPAPLTPPLAPPTPSSGFAATELDGESVDGAGPGGWRGASSPVRGGGGYAATASDVAATAAAAEGAARGGAGGKGAAGEGVEGRADMGGGTAELVGWGGAGGAGWGPWSLVDMQLVVGQASKHRVR